MSLRFLDNAFKNIMKMRLIKVVWRRYESTPVEIVTLGLHGIYPYRQMSVVEAKSSEASAEE